jgi:hypothetical protein
MEKNISVDRVVFGPKIEIPKENLPEDDTFRVAIESG